ncbi:MAG: DUF3299 domain-containing protein [Planctomycetota bacterium]
MRVAAWIPLLALLPQDPVETSFEVLAGFDYRPGMVLPAEVKKLDEQTVTLRGFMMREVPGSDPVGQFLLINDACGCNGTPKLNEIVYCALPDGVTTDVRPGIVHVTGKLYVGEQREDGEVFAIYVLDADRVR